MELKAEKPALAGLAPVRAVLPQQAHPAMPQTMTDGQRFGIDQIESWIRGGKLGCRYQQSTDLRSQSLQASHPLWVGAKARKSRAVIMSHQPVGLLQTGDPEAAWQQSNG
jgi:hypothetical protein